MIEINQSIIENTESMIKINQSIIKNNKSIIDIDQSIIENNESMIEINHSIIEINEAMINSAPLMHRSFFCTGRSERETRKTWILLPICTVFAKAR